MFNSSFDKLLNSSAIKYLFNIFEKEQKEVRLVGGCVRDSLLSREYKDIDIAAKFEPVIIVNILNKYKIIFEDYAYKYGSIIAYIKDQKIQITSLREDINQIGRNTNIVYTNDWEKDSERRDFSINALYLSSDGKVTDFHNGIKDIKDKKVDFIGIAEERIKEDYLRIFRYIRFLGLFDRPNYNKNYEILLNDYIPKSFKFLSNDIIRQEILKMFHMPYALNCFFQNIEKRKKREWVKITESYFIKKNYELGLRKCLNKIDLLIN